MSEPTIIVQSKNDFLFICTKTHLVTSVSVFLPLLSTLFSLFTTVWLGQTTTIITTLELKWFFPHFPIVTLAHWPIQYFCTPRLFFANTQDPKALLCDCHLKVISHLRCAKRRKVGTRKLNFIPFLLGWIYSPSDILQTLRHSIFLIAKILVASLLSLVMVCSPVLAVKIDTFT